MWNSAKLCVLLATYHTGKHYIKKIQKQKTPKTGVQFSGLTSSKEMSNTFLLKTISPSLTFFLKKMVNSFF